jgi:hypothetical protein
MFRYEPKASEPVGRFAMIYFLQDTVTQEIKIGDSKKSPEQRRRDCQTGNPHKLILLGTITGRREDEDCYHGKFAQHRLEGEWFKGEIIEEVLGIISAHQQSRLIIRRKIVNDTTEPKVNGEPEATDLPSKRAG